MYITIEGKVKLIHPFFSSILLSFIFRYTAVKLAIRTHRLIKILYQKVSAFANSIYECI